MTEVDVDVDVDVEGAAQVTHPLLSDVLRGLQSHLGRLEVVAHDEHGLVLQPNLAHDSLVIIRVEDALRPLYSVTYEALSAEAVSVKEARTRTSSLVFQGLEWIVESVRDHGFVLPEFPHPRLIKSLRSGDRSGRSR